MRKVTLFWIFAFVITAFAVVYQRQTGPTYPRKVHVQFDDTTLVKLKLPRSAECNAAVDIVLPKLSLEWNGYIYYRRFPTNDEWSVMPFLLNENDEMVASLPSDLPPAAKLEYYLEFDKSFTDVSFAVAKDAPLIIRFKGAVPSWALMPHIVLMFIAMLFSNLVGIMALFKSPRFRFYGMLTFILLLVGGLIFGPVVQYYAFGQAWTGFPVGADLTDNKTLIAFLFWLVAVIANWKKERPWLSVFAALVTLVVYLIPHSMRGSQFDYETGKVITGMVMPIL